MTSERLITLEFAAPQQKIKTSQSEHRALQSNCWAFLRHIVSIEHFTMKNIYFNTC